MLAADEVQRLGSALKRYLGTHAAYAILDGSSLSGATWTAGGCWALAKALSRLLQGTRTVAVVDQGVQHHVLLRVGTLYLDADGASTEAQLLRRWRVREGLHAPKLQPFSARDAGEIRCPEDLVRPLEHALAAVLPWSQILS